MTDITASLLPAAEKMLGNPIIILLALLPFMGKFILTIVSKWNILEKAGESGWTALVPFYGNYLFHDIIWDNGWYFLASYVPGISYVVGVISKVKLSNHFDKNSVFALGLVLFEPVFLAILAFDESDYYG